MTFRWPRRLGCAVCLLAMVPFAGLAAGAKHGGKADVPLEQVPQVIVDAAHERVEGITLIEAKLRTKKSGVVFKLEGVADGRSYRFKVDAAGTVLRVEAVGDDKPA